MIVHDVYASRGEVAVSEFIRPEVAWNVSCLPGSDLLGGSWVVIRGVISSAPVLITHIRGLMTPLITTHGPPSRNEVSKGQGWWSHQRPPRGALRMLHVQATAE